MTSGRRGGLLPLYHCLTWLLPVVPRTLARRAHLRQGASVARLGERRGQATLPRPQGALLWVHAASVGEVAAVAPLAARLATTCGARLLVTTTTATGGEAVARLLPAALHQFLPADAPRDVARFLDRWRPDLAIMVESDLWPNLLATTRARRTPLALVNARASRSRRRMPRTQAALLAGFDLITTQDGAVRDAILALGLPPARVIAAGDLKAATPAPAADPDVLARLAQSLGPRRRWAAVSTHPADLPQVLAAHAAARRLHPDLLLILVPRHPDRPGATDGVLPDMPRWSRRETPAPDAPVWVVDTIGDTGLVYALAPLVFLGGSFGPEGGHNPWEPALAGAAVLAGPRTPHAAAAYGALVAAGGAEVVADGDALGEAVATLTASPALARMQTAARATATGASAALERTLVALLDLWQQRRDQGI